MTVDGTVAAYRTNATEGTSAGAMRMALGFGDVDTNPSRVDTHRQACFTPVLG